MTRTIGTKVELQGVNKFVADSERVNAAITKTNATLGKQAALSGKAVTPDAKSVATKFSGDLAKEIQSRFVAQAGKVGGSAGRSLAETFSDAVGKKLGGTTQSILSKVGDGFGGLSGGAGKAALAVGAVGAALLALKVGLDIVKKLSAAFNELGQQGARVQGIAEAFESITRRAQVQPTKFLDTLREASSGTIADTDLMRQTNVALSGVSGDLQGAFIEGLPNLLQIAQAQARATGQDVQFLFESLVSGIKRGSPLLIDNTGLVVKLGDANEKLAKSLGVTVEQLTDEQKKIALLQATIEAGKASVDDFARSQENAATVAAQVAATQKNTKDTLALAIQPLFLAFQKVRLAFASTVQGVVKTLAPLIHGASEILGEIVNIALSAARTFANVFIKPFTRELRYVIFFVRVVQKSIVAFLKGFQIAAGVIGQIIQNALQQVGQILVAIFPFLKNLQGGFFQGAAALFGALAGGIILAANEYIFPIIIDIATFIADFLTGESPAKRGPLSKIDKGAQKLMEAWTAGIAGVNLDPVEKVSKQVMDMLGNIGKFNLKQVEARLRQLDAAIKPFEDRLKLVQARLEAITAPLEKAKSIIEEKLNKAVEGLLEGSVSAETVRALDKQTEAINARLEAAQEEADLAELQLALAKSIQAEERAALGVRLSMLKAKKKDKDITESTGGAGAGGGAEEEPIGGAGGAELPPLTGGGSIFGDLLGDLGLGGAGGDLAGAFGRGLGSTAGPDGFGQFGANFAELSAQGGRIAGGLNNLPNKIAEAFTSLPQKVGEQLELLAGTITGFFDPLAGRLAAIILPGVNMIRTAWNGLFGEGEGGLRAIFRTSIGGVVRLADKFINGEDGLSLKGIFDGLITSVTDIFKPEDGGLFYDAISGIPDLLNSIFVGSTATVLNGFLDLIESAINAVIDAINEVIGGDVGGIFRAGADIIGVDVPDEIKRIDIPGIMEARAGGMFDPGIIKVHKDEYIAPAQRVMVFPQQLSRAISRVLEQPIVSSYQSASSRQTNFNIGNVNNYHPTDTTTSVVRLQHMAALNRL